MQVLFLALGANRRRAVIEESRRVVEHGGRAVVLVTSRSAWSAETFAPGVRVLALPSPDTHWPLRAEQVVLFRGPRFVLARAARVLKRSPKRWIGAYEKRVANRMHRKVFLPVYRKAWPDQQKRALAAQVRAGGPYDAFVVTDPISFPVARELIGSERVAFRIDQLVTPANSDKGKV
ncbi:hypothetical protein OHA21_35190 [Actinoplanes sp. NBC_00393]|uniref:hypothetical protein n=1 Tax=Actinoplanes sp. NBC_00393 TaxID=2975953 RepID=UPI002E1E6EBA